MLDHQPTEGTQKVRPPKGPSHFLAATFGPAVN
jgi:hypothetical protein